MVAILQSDGAGGTLAAALGPLAVIAAYKRYVNFKTNVLGIQPVAATTNQANNGWALCRIVE